MMRSWAAALLLATLFNPAAPALADALEDLYSAKAIVTGQGERNRQPGFRDCLDQVIVRVSGDQRLLARPDMAALRARAGEFVRSFSYRDRLEGIPVHDEQGTHDRPHDLTCRYEPAVIDRVLARLGSHPWLERRPLLAVFLHVRRGQQDYRVDKDNARDQAMRESFALGSAPLAMKVVFPSAEDAQAVDPDAAAARAGAEKALVGTLTWSDKDLGWVATWRLAGSGDDRGWQVKGVSFDEAFRVAVRGAAQILSGNGTPR